MILVSAMRGATERIILQKKQKAQNRYGNFSVLSAISVNSVSNNNSSVTASCSVRRIYKSAASCTLSFELQILILTLRRIEIRRTNGATGIYAFALLKDALSVLAHGPHGSTVDAGVDIRKHVHTVEVEAPRTVRARLVERR